MESEKLMFTALRDPSWRSVDSVSVADAAGILGRSTSWVRDKITGGRLDADRSGRVIVVTTVSIAELLTQLAKRRGPDLRLVVDNDRGK
jgi:hypothetical protein